MELTVLGCGDAFGSGGRFNTSFLVTQHNEHILLDCGATTLVRLKMENIKLEDISTIFITHFHGDHYGGLPFILISSLFETPRKKRLNIVGPPGVEANVYALQEAMYAGTTELFGALDLNFYEYRSGEDLKVGDKVVFALNVEHSTPSHPHGIKITWNDRVIAYSGDTSWTDNLLALGKGADLFICECNYVRGVNFGHLSFEEIQERLPFPECKALYFTHMNEEAFNSPQIPVDKLYDGLKIRL